MCVWWECVRRGGREGGGEGYLCLRYFGVCGDVAVVLLGELGFSFPEVFAGGVEGGFRHGCCGGMLDGLLSGYSVLLMMLVMGVVAACAGWIVIVERLRDFGALTVSEGWVTESDDVTWNL